MFEWKEKASNEILLDNKVGGKGKQFRTRFLQAGLVKYSFGVCLLDKDVIDKFIYDFIGCPVIINHKDVTPGSAKDDRVGVISRVWFDEFDGWYWGEGVIFDQEALNLIDKGYNVSCQYEITEYSENRENKLHNGNPYDKTILNGRPEHLAIVENPRYENAMIAINAIEAENGGEGSGIKGHTTERPMPLLKKDREELVEKLEKEQNKNISEDDVRYKAHKVAIRILQDNIEEIDNKIKKAKNDIIQAINEIKENPMFKSLFKKEKKMDKEEMKSLFMECLTELTATNKAEEEVKKEVKEEKEEVAENKCKNEEPDYKKLYEDLKAECEKAKNEEEEKKEKENEKAKNAILSGSDVKAPIFITEKRAKELGKELF